LNETDPCGFSIRRDFSESSDSIQLGAPESPAGISSEGQEMLDANGYAVHSPSDPFAPFAFERRDPRANDVVVAILHCGICHSDLHTARGEWGGTRFP
jgi:hypothetical protein